MQRVALNLSAISQTMVPWPLFTLAPHCSAAYLYLRTASLSSSSIDEDKYDRNPHNGIDVDYDVC